MRFGWSLERSTWREVGEAYARKPWRCVPLAPLHQSLVPEMAGIYAICTCGTQLTQGLLAKLYNAVYVGQAVDLRRRFLDHSRHPGRELQRALNAFQTLDFYFMTASLEDLNHLESLLIDCLGPSANQQAGIAARLGEPIAI